MPEKALKKARRFCRAHEDELLFEDYSDSLPVEEIVIQNAAYDELAVWQDEDLHLRFAARELLAAAELVVARWERGDLAGAVRELDAVIARAKGGAA
jgi:hypothetical protein